MNCYHLKDWIKNDPTLAISGDDVENFIRNNRCMRLCADICNGAKHLELERPRSNEQPEIRSREFHLEFGAPGPIIKVKYRIQTNVGPEDAFALATECLQKWEGFIAQNDLEV